MSERHREAWLGRFAMHADATNRIQQIMRDLLRDLAPVTYAICSFVHPQQNCEKPIRTIFFWPQQARKSGAARVRDLTRSVPLGTVKCAKGGRAFMPRTISHASSYGRLRASIEVKRGRTFGAKFCARVGQFAGILLVLALCALASSPSRAANWFEKNFWLSGPRYNRVVPACDYPAALDRIIANFRTKEFRFWNSELRIVGFENIRELDFLPWAAQAIPRRFCSGIAVINDGGRHTIYYSIAEDTGMIGMDWGVNICVAGLDRDWAYNPSCRAAGP